MKYKISTQKYFNEENQNTNTYIHTHAYITTCKQIDLYMCVYIYVYNLQANNCMIGIICQSEKRTYRLSN